MKSIFRCVLTLFVMLFALVATKGSTHLHEDVKAVHQIRLLSTNYAFGHLPELSSNEHHALLFSDMLDVWECKDFQDVNEVSLLLYYTIIPVWLSAMNISVDERQNFKFPTEPTGVIRNPRYILFRCIKIPI
ncbi:hypothetical protein ACFX5U_17025 [Sphingobacterium sp. SG20118]|uniref:hypothetical protein n=1 Tax=Sphingobacterium sp. SG20118 TaxID=3367156 RepID=UPI0037DFC3FB